MKKELIPRWLSDQLQSMPTLGGGYQYVHLYLKGPLDWRPSTFRIQVIVNAYSELEWPEEALGSIGNYELLRFVEITKENSHTKRD